MRAWFAAILFALWMPLPVMAAETRALAPEEMSDWAAFGRLSFNRRDEAKQNGCSATLIAPDLVVTAAHCVVFAFDGAPSKVRQLIFQAGWHTDEAIASATAAAIKFHPEYRPGDELTFAQKLPSDIALVYLTEPLETVTPAPLGNLDGAFELLSFVVYQGAMTNPPRLASGCSHAPLSQRLLQVGCPVVGGNSGGGIWIDTGAERALVGVISASSGARALAVLPDDWLLAEVAAHVGEN